MDPLVPSTPSDTPGARPTVRWGTSLLYGLTIPAAVLWVIPFFTASSMTLNTYASLVTPMAALAGMGVPVGLMLISRRRTEIATPRGVGFVGATLLCVVILAYSILVAIEAYRAAKYAATKARMLEVAGALSEYANKPEQVPAKLADLRNTDVHKEPWETLTGEAFAFDTKEALKSKKLTLDEGDKGGYASPWFRPLLVTGFAVPENPRVTQRLLVEAYGRPREVPIVVPVGE